ncbi:MAG: hypothetical protein KKA79_06470, partial [Nanoarchaeota archaeon]|nr:hypothetical protein [Nanoarchaeota archaeon]
NPDWIIYVRLNFKPLINLPQKWDEVFKRMHLLKNDERKLEIIDYVFRRYRLRYIKNDDYERQLLKQLEGSKTVL